MPFFGWHYYFKLTLHFLKYTCSKRKKKEKNCSFHMSTVGCRALRIQFFIEKVIFDLSSSLRLKWQESPKLSKWANRSKFFCLSIKNIMPLVRFESSTPEPLLKYLYHLAIPFSLGMDEWSLWFWIAVIIFKRGKEKHLEK